MRSHVRISHSSRSVAAMEFEAQQEAARSLPPLPPADLDMPTMQQLAIMTMHESHVARAVAARLREHVQCRPSWIDYHELRELGLADKRANDSYHRLTFEGVRIAKELERKLCCDFGIHHMIEAGHSGPNAVYLCCCGQWSAHIQRGSYTYRNAHARFSKHVATANGMRILTDALRPVKEG